MQFPDLKHKLKGTFSVASSFLSFAKFSHERYYKSADTDNVVCTDHQKDSVTFQFIPV